MSKYGVFCDLYFPVFIFEVNYHILSAHGKMRTRKNSLVGHFWHSDGCDFVLFDLFPACFLPWGIEDYKDFKSLRLMLSIYKHTCSTASQSVKIAGFHVHEMTSFLPLFPWWQQNTVGFPHGTQWNSHFSLFYHVFVWPQFKN